MSQAGEMDRQEALETLFGPGRERGPLRPESDHLVDAAQGAELRVRFHAASPEDPMILSFPGEGEVASDYDGEGSILVRRELSLVAAEYRGTGGSSGHRDPGALLDDAAAVFGYVKGWREDHSFTGPLILMGRSLGTAAALDVAARFPGEVAGLILVAGFSRPKALVEGLGLSADPLGITEEEGFGNLEKIGELDIPLLVIHGQEDEVVGLIESMTLHQHSPARSKQLVVVPRAGHYDLQEKGAGPYYDAMAEFAFKVAGRRIRRPRRARKTRRAGKKKLRARVQEIEVRSKPKF